MSTDSHITDIPKTFARCFNKSCKRAEECLHHLVTRLSPGTPSIVYAVNPDCTGEEGELCPYFQPARLERFARGMSRMLDRIPHADSLVIKKRMLAYFGPNLYYRLRRRERLFTPAQQEYIRQLFLQQGINETPEFDEYIERYDW